MGPRPFQQAPRGGGRGGRAGGIPVPNGGQPMGIRIPMQQAGASAAPMPPPDTPPPAPVAPREKKIDQALMKQLRGRYEVQNEHDQFSKSAIVGLLDVDACLKVIAENDVTFVVTDTGTGKSSLVPDGLLRLEGTKVANSQPRRTAAVNLAHRVAVDLRKEKVGATVGYWVRGEHVGDVDTCRLMYMTSYTLLLYLLGHPDDLPFTHIIIDEFHERQPDVEVMLGLLKLALLARRDAAAANGSGSGNPLKKRLPAFKVILMSASVELEMWKSYFDGLVVGEYTTCQARYPVHEYYREEVCRLVDRAPNVDEKLSAVVSSLQLKNVELFIEDMLFLLAELADPNDSILVFLPGRTMVESMAHTIETKLGRQLEAIPWYRDIDLTTIQAALQRPATTRKKVYLATDIAEVSLTLPDVVFVIDSGMTKKPRIDVTDRNSVAFPPLELLWCSKSAVIQRKGRVGRVQQGFFFSMIPEAHKQDLVEMEPQIANATIHELVLHSLQISNAPMQVFNLCRVTPKTVSVMLSLQVLLDGGFVAASGSGLCQEESTEVAESLAWRDIVGQARENQRKKATPAVDASPAAAAASPDVAAPAAAAAPAGVEDPAFSAAYLTTYRGKISQHLPLNLEASQMVFIGALFGLESLMSIAAAIVACGSPFYAQIEDRTSKFQARFKVIDALSKEMKTYAYGLPSDIIAALHIVLLYMHECRGESLTPLAEENWCEARSVKRSRIQDILRLELQTREQFSQQCAFAHVADALVLQKQLEKHAPLVSALAAASHLERALFVQNGVQEAQKQRKVGPSLFLGVSANRDNSISTVCPWALHSIVVPLSIQTRYSNLLGSFATQLSQAAFNKLFLLMVPRVVYERREAREEPQPGPALTFFGAELHGQKQAFVTDKITGQDILTFRKALSAKYSAMRVQMDSKLADPFDNSIVEALRTKGHSVLPPTIRTQGHIAELLRFLFESIMKEQPTPVQGRFCDPYNGEIRPQQESLIASSCDGIIPYTAQKSLTFHVPVPPPPPGAAAAAAAPPAEVHVLASPLVPFSEDE